MLACPDKTWFRAFDKSLLIAGLHVQSHKPEAIFTDELDKPPVTAFCGGVTIDEMNYKFLQQCLGIDCPVAKSVECIDGEYAFLPCLPMIGMFLYIIGFCQLV